MLGQMGTDALMTNMQADYNARLLGFLKSHEDEIMRIAGADYDAAAVALTPDAMMDLIDRQTTVFDELATEITDPDGRARVQRMLAEVFFGTMIVISWIRLRQSLETCRS